MRGNFNPLDQLKSPVDLDEEIKEAVRLDDKDRKDFEEEQEREKIKFKKVAERSVIITYTYLIFLAILVSVVSTLNEHVYRTSIVFILIVVAFACLRQYNAIMNNTRAVSSMLAKLSTLHIMLDKAIKSDSRNSSLLAQERAIKNLIAEIKNNKHDK